MLRSAVQHDYRDCAPAQEEITTDMTQSTTSEEKIRSVLESWAEATRKGRLDEVLSDHLPEALIYDVLAPMKYEGTQAYRASWGDWQPETAGEGTFDLEDLQVTAGENIGFAHCFIRCGGTMPDGKSFTDLVRATFCLVKDDGRWMVDHQHISKPLTLSS